MSILNNGKELTYFGNSKKPSEVKEDKKEVKKKTSKTKNKRGK